MAIRSVLAERPFWVESDDSKLKADIPAARTDGHFYKPPQTAHAENCSLMPTFSIASLWQSTARRFLNWPPVKQSFKQR